MYSSCRIALITIVAFIWCLTFPGSPGAQPPAGKHTVRIAYTDWSSSVASAHLLKAVFLEKTGTKCKLMRMPVDDMWEAVARGEADAMLSAWLPHTHAHYYNKYSGRQINLGPNLKGTRIGLVVPDITLGRLTAGTGIRNRPYIDVGSINELKEKAGKFKNRIIGIEPEAGIMRRTRQAMEVYDLEEDFRLAEGSEKSMVAALSEAVRHQEWIVVTGWLPHWSFARWNLKFLDDPKNIYGPQGHISTIVRKDLEEEMPEAYRILDNFYWEPRDLGQLMLWIQENKGDEPYETALRWIRANEKKVKEWLK
ncbi:MAG: glycine betaine ABC transporter substrate-binding protein [Desulfurivibrionaceae bacterium]